MKFWKRLNSGSAVVAAVTLTACGGSKRKQLKRVKMAKQN